MSLQSGIAVIFGSNVGTTVTAWIVATLGFKVKIELFALPMIGTGGLLLALGSASRRVSAFAKVAIGFGLLFLGLDIMKTAIESGAANLDLATFADYPLIAFVGIGFMLTALIQSSSAATAIVLSALYAQILTFEQSAAMVIGTNIGTTVTAALGAIGGIPDKKRVAAAHFLFNVITAGAAFLMLPLLSHLINQTFDMAGDPTTALALFHTLFNMMGVILLTPFIAVLSRWLGRMFIKVKTMPTRYIHKVDPQVPDTALIALRNEVSHLFVKTMKFGLLLANIKPGDLFVKNMDTEALVTANPVLLEFDHKRAYSAIKEMEIAIFEFAALLNQQNLTPEQSQSIEPLLMSVRESVYAAKILKDIRNNMEEFAESDNHSVQRFYEALRRNLAYVMIIYKRYIDETWTAETCREKFERALKENHNIMREVTLSVSEPGINEKTVVSLLNTNRSIFIAGESLLDASYAVTLHFDLEAERTA